MSKGLGIWLLSAWLGLVAGFGDLAAAPETRPASPFAADTLGVSLSTPLPGPLTIPPVLTSSFCEYRAGHYHGGLDFSTGGRTGEPIPVPAPGWVYRLRASGVGYGKAVYFRLDDGRTLVFGHLSRFHPTLAAAVEAEQDRRQSYEVDLRPAPGTMRMEPGEILAYTGSSGAGPPHLHAEVRVGPEASVAINPALATWAVPDTLAPTLTRLRVEPAAAGATVDGGFDPVTISLGGRAPSVAIAGPVRLWVEAGDRAGRGSGRLAPHRLVWSVNGEPVAETRLDQVDWNWPREVKWTFHQALARTENERWMAMAPPPRTRQKMSRWLTEGPFAWNLEAGEHVLRIEAVDAAGNRTAREVELRWGVHPTADSGPAPGASPEPPPARTELFSRGGHLELRMTVAGDRLPGPKLYPARIADPLLLMNSDFGWDLRDGSRHGGHLYQCSRPPEPGLWFSAVTQDDGSTDTTGAVFVEPGRGWTGRVPLSGQVTRLAVDDYAMYEELWIAVKASRAPVRPDPRAPELVPVAGEIALEPWAHPLRESITVEMDAPAGASRRGLALYAWDDGWGIVGADTSGTGVAGSIGNLETLALLRDETPPAITPERAGARARPRLRARITDGGSGIAWRDLAMTLDGTPVIAEWDPDARVLTGHLRRDLPAGEHEWVVTAADRVGNESRVVTVVVVP